MQHLFGGSGHRRSALPALPLRLPNTSIQNFQVRPKDLSIRSVAGGTHALRPQGEPAMSEQAVEERRGWASDIVWVVVYSILVLLVMLLWVYVPA